MFAIYYKWEKKCKELSNFEQSSSGRFAASMHASSKDIQTQFTFNCTASLENNRIDHFAPTISYDVTPLQNHTNERCFPSCLGIARVGDVESESHVGSSSSSSRSVHGGLIVQDMSFGQATMGRLAGEIVLIIFSRFLYFFVKSRFILVSLYYNS